MPYYHFSRLLDHIPVTDADQSDFYHCMAAKYPI